MSLVGKVLGIASIGGAIAESPIPRKLLSSLATVAALAVVSALMIGALLVGGLYAGYYILLNQGFSADAALIITAGAAVVIIIVLISVTVHYAKSLFDMPKLMPAMSDQNNIVGQVSGIANSFMDGLLTREVNSRRG